MCVRRLQFVGIGIVTGPAVANSSIPDVVATPTTLLQKTSAPQSVVTLKKKMKKLILPRVATLRTEAIIDRFNCQVFKLDGVLLFY